ncbi:MAG: carboxypeptidase-like regulatory domain-containing protein [Planctomycetota bacterium]|nr:carboxypeptidase-like regulatory domain-containing protein [Planctomycetota bacterium]
MRALVFSIPLLLLVGLFLFLRTSEADGPEQVGGLQGQEGFVVEAPPSGPEAAPEVNLRGVTQEVNERVGGPQGTQTDLPYPVEIDLVLLQAGEPVETDQEIRSGAKASLRGSLHTDTGKGLVGDIEFLAGANKGRRVPCAADGPFLVTDLYPGLSSVRAGTGQGRYSVREIRLGQLSTTTLNISFGQRSSAQVRGRVVDPFGKAVGQAEVKVDGQAAFTDDEGYFEIYRVTAGHLLVEIKATGFARYRETLPISRGANIPRERLTFTIEPEAHLDIALMGSVGAPGPALVYLFPSGGQRVNKQRGQRTFPWYTVNPILVEPGRSVSVGGLPKGHVTVMTFKGGAAAKPARRNVNLDPQRRATLEVSLEPGPSLTGQALVDGKPAAGASVRMEALDPSATSMHSLGRRPSFRMEMVFDLLPAAVQTAKADSRGRFQLTTHPDIDAEYVLEITSADRRHRTVKRITKMQADMKVDLQPVRGGNGDLQIQWDTQGKAIPYRVRVAGEVGTREVLPGGEVLSVPDLATGLWRVDVSYNGRFLERGQRFWVGEGDLVERSFEIPADILNDRPR